MNSRWGLPRPAIMNSRWGLPRPAVNCVMLGFTPASWGLPPAISCYNRSVSEQVRIQAVLARSHCFRPPWPPRMSSMRMSLSLRLASFWQLPTRRRRCQPSSTSTCSTAPGRRARRRFTLGTQSYNISTTVSVIVLVFVFLFCFCVLRVWLSVQLVVRLCLIVCVCL